MKNFKWAYILALLLCVSTSCVSKDVGEWSNWRYTDSDYEVTYSKSRFKKSSGLHFSKYSKQAEVPTIRFSLEFDCAIARTDHYERKRKTLITTHYPPIASSFLHAKENLGLVIFLPITAPLSIIAYPKRYDTSEYNRWDDLIELENKSDVSKYREYQDFKNLKKDPLTFIIKELDQQKIIGNSDYQINLPQRFNDLPIIDYLLTLDQLTIAIAGHDNDLKLDLSNFKSHENKRRSVIAEEKKKATEKKELDDWF
ncbi:MAG: hypothetical protein MJK04_30995 [Psychrosphaera sp.]|nr:hypothetical protein [Psychrosphaera sp.]